MSEWAKRICVAPLFVLLVASLLAALPPKRVEAARPDLWPVVFQDSFDDSGRGWLTGTAQSIGRRYVDGAYEIAIGIGGTGAVSRIPGGVMLSDVSVEADICVVEGSGSLGFAVRYRSGGDFYCSIVDARGDYLLALSEGSAWRTLDRVTHVGGFELQRPTHIQVVVQGGTFSFFIDGTLLSKVTQYPSASIQDGELGLCAFADEDSQLVVRFDNLVVRRADPAIEAMVEEAGRLLLAGQSQFRQSRWEDAAQSFQEAMRIYAELGLASDEADVQIMLGHALRSGCDYQRAISAYAAAGEDSRRLDDWRGEASAATGRGICYYWLGDYTTAVAYHNSAMDLARAHDDRASEAASIVNIGNCQFWRADYGGAMESYSRSLDAFREVQQQERDQAAQRQAAGVMLLTTSQVQPRPITYAKSFSMLFPGAGSDEGEAGCLNNLGICSIVAGDYQRASEYLEQAIAAYQTLRDQGGEAMSLGNLALCYYWLEDLQQAIRFQERSLAIMRTIGDTWGEAASLSNLGLCDYALHKYPEAIQYHQQSLEGFRRVGDRRGEATALGNLGLCYHGLGQYAMAIGWHVSALAISEEIGDVAGQVICRGNLGEEYLALAQYGQAIESYSRSLDLLGALAEAARHESGMPEAEWRVREGFGRANRDAGNLVEAAGSFEEAAAFVEASRTLLDRAGFKLSFMRERFTVYRQLVPVLIALGQGDESLSYAERAKSRALVDMMSTALVLRADLLPADLQTQARIAGELHRQAATREDPFQIVEARVLPQSGSVQAARLIEESYDAALADLERKNPVLAETLSVSPDQLVAYSLEVRSRLGADTVALEYFVTDAETILWVITEGGIQTASRIMVSRENLAQAVKGFRDVVQAPPLDPALPVLSYHKILQQAKPLYDLLIAPVEGYLAGVEHLVIIPSDVLFYVPFAVLYQCPDGSDLYRETVTRCAAGADGSRPTGHFLIERFTLSYAPSLASLYWPLQHEGDGSYTSVLSVGNPTGDLLAAQAEATTVAGLFPDATLLLREEGTEARVKEELGAMEYDVVHLSTHGLFDPTMPLLSEVVLREGGREDGHLYAGEILGLSLSQTELVVMSACQTALPPEINQDVVVGDEIQGLGQALFVAGVPTALLTLWNVNDASTGELMVEFYQNLMTGQAKAESLAAAQLALLNGDYGLAYRHPYYWAPFVMYGDWSTQRRRQ
jgi:CHAT domain-containing protein/Tfp pilus assembly protein PilF